VFHRLSLGIDQEWNRRIHDAEVINQENDDMGTSLAWTGIDSVWLFVRGCE
jgi:hypothetical protein